MLKMDRTTTVKTLEMSILHHCNGCFWAANSGWLTGLKASQPRELKSSRVLYKLKANQHLVKHLFKTAHISNSK